MTYLQNERERWDLVAASTHSTKCCYFVVDEEQDDLLGKADSTSLDEMAQLGWSSSTKRDPI